MLQRASRCAGPGNYKIPTAYDIPRDFRVKLLENLPNARAVHSSKAVGEPPFHLGACTLFALKDAIASARADAGARRAGLMPQCECSTCTTRRLTGCGQAVRK